MELRHLRYFLAVADELHFGRAATRLGIKQPPLSRQIQNLEAELGVTLFERTNRRVELTAYGRFLRDGAEKLIEQADRLRNSIGLIRSGTAGRVRIGYVGSAMHSILPALLRDLRRSHPQIYPEFSEMDGDAQVQAMLSGEIDVGFLRPPIRASELSMHIVLEEPFALVLPADHRLARAKRIRLDALAEEPFVGFCRACAPGMADDIVAICNDAGFSPRTVHETTQLNALLRLVESGLGYSIVPASVRSGYDLSLRFVELAAIPQRAQLAAIFHPRMHTAPTETVMAMLLARRTARGAEP